MAPAINRLAEVCDYQVGVERGVLDRDSLLAGVREADGLICLLTDVVDREVIEAGTRLQVIANVAVGYNNIDVAAAREHGVYVTNTPDVLTEATANLTWALILAVTRRIVEADAFTRAGKFTGWDFDMLLGSGITGKTLGVVGYGRIGRAVARRATGSECRLSIAGATTSLFATIHITTRSCSRARARQARSARARASTGLPPGASLSISCSKWRTSSRCTSRWLRPRAA
jgi:lactate dehydrogenase-like 2-hydroxyacid dehydrogenase